MTATPSRRRSSRSSASRRGTQAAQPIQPYVTRQIPYFEVLGDEGLSVIENNAETILEEVGIDFRDDEEALQIWRDAGADVQGERVRIPRGLCRKLIQEKNIDVPDNCSPFDARKIIANETGMRL